MPPARTARQRALNNENDENSTTQRVTRAKAAALDKPNDTGTLAGKKPLQAKKGATNVKANTKRSALGDVSNTHKVGESDKTQSKKAVQGPAAKAAQPTGVQKKASPKKASPKKVARTDSTSTRVALLDKDKNSTASATNDLKRPASAAGINGNVPKRRAGSNPSSRKSEETQTDENSAPPQPVKTRITEKTVTDFDGAGAEVKRRVETNREIIEEDNAFRDELEQRIETMDDEDAGDPLMVSEYVYEILDYMKELEERTMPNPDYMDHQNELEWRMRGVLIDWLLEVHQRFHLLPETFYLTVNIIDRFLTHKVVQLERLQLVGVAAMFIASKYEEVLSPHIGNFVRVADEGFSEAEILSAERYILQVLGYDLSYPNPMHFMRRISKADNYDIQTRTLAKYLLEITLLDHQFLGYPPSLNSAAAMHLSRIILEKGDWDDILVHYSGYTEEEIMPAVEIMIDYLRAAVTHNAFYRKYAHKKFLRASIHARQWAKTHAHEILGNTSQ
ncbi:MAG: hypothetical protein Q9162_003703 [Coniocarpon cinnabarinum]